MLLDHVESSDLSDQDIIKSLEFELHEIEKNHEKQMLEKSHKIEMLAREIFSKGEEINMLNSNVSQLFEIASSKETKLSQVSEKCDMLQKISKSAKMLEDVK